MSAKKNLWLATASALVLFSAAPVMAQNDANVTIVDSDGPAEEAGEAVDNAAEATGEAAENAAEATADAADKATDAAADAADDAADAAENAADATADAADDAADATEEAAEDTAEAADEAMDEASETDADVTVTQAEEGDGPAEGTPVEGQIFEQSADTYLASTLMDSVVYNAADEEIGDVNDMIINSDGSVEGVVIGVGGFLGVGEKNVAVELSRLEMTTDENGDTYFMLDTTAEELEAAPEFMTAEDAAQEAEANAAGATTGAAGTGAVGTGAATGAAGTAPAAPSSN